MGDDLLPDPQFFSSAPSQYVINGQTMRAEKIDDATVKLIFAGAYLNFPRVLATPLGQHPVPYRPPRVVLRLLRVWARP